MFRVLSSQHYQHRTNQKLRSWANAVFQNRGVCGQAFPSFPSPSPSSVIPFCALFPIFSTDSRGNACYAGYLKLTRLIFNDFTRFSRQRNGQINMSSFEPENVFKFLLAWARLAREKHKIFTYSHANTPLGQSERAYLIFINFHICDC